MAKASLHQTHYTRQAQQLLTRTYGRSILNDSVLERAINYFEHHEFVASDVSTSPESEALHKLEQTGRHSHLQSICNEILELTEGESFEESNRKSAQLLGTIQLISPTEGSKIAENNELCKAIYKAILSIRLLDRLLLNNEVNDPYILKVLEEFEGKSFADFDALEQLRFTELVKMPLIMAALLQDIGHNHAHAQTILRGEDGNQDPQRTLAIEDRKKLLKINHKQTLAYISDGLGIPSYVGNSKAERDQFVVDEQLKHQFTKKIIQSSFKAKQGIGNLLKVPQIYASIILSTKASYNYKLLPKVYQALNQNVEKGTCSKAVVNALHQITGDFPQGFGITYIPKDSDGKEGEQYEYAIVNQLYPKKAEEPVCRAATKNLTFISHGQDFVVKAESNLYLPETAKQLSKISKERLNEILELLSSNYQERKSLDLIPRCWQTQDFFEIKNNQKLWNKVADV